MLDRHNGNDTAQTPDTISAGRTAGPLDPKTMTLLDHLPPPSFTEGLDLTRYPLSGPPTHTENSGTFTDGDLVADFLASLGLPIDRFGRGVVSDLPGGLRFRITTTSSCNDEETKRALAKLEKEGWFAQRNQQGSDHKGPNCYTVLDIIAPSNGENIPEDVLKTISAAVMANLRTNNPPAERVGGLPSYMIL